MTGYEVTTAHVPPYAGAGLPAAEVARILHGLDPAALQEAGAAHTALGRELDTMAAQLTQESQTLAQHWSGAAARRAQTQFQQLHTQTATLAAQATRTGSVLTWLGTQVVPAFRAPSDARQAQQYLTSLSAALVRANGALPAEIGGSGTAQLASATPGPAPGNSGSPGSPAPGNPASGSPAPGSPASGSPAPGSPASGNPAPADLASLNNPSGPTQPGNPTAPSDLVAPGNPASPTGSPSPASPATTSGQAQPAPLASRLQSAAPAPAQSAEPARTAPEAAADPAPAPAGVAATPAPLISSVAARPTRAKQPATPGPAGQDSGLSGGTLPLQPGTDPTAPATLAGAPAPASHNPPGALPMAGGVSSQSDHERHRESWAPEDRNPWGLPDICVPPLIEGP